MNQEYSSGKLMAAILDLRDGVAASFEQLENRFNGRLETEIGGLRHDMNRRFDSVDLRFDSVDLRFDRVDQRLDTLEARVF